MAKTITAFTATPRKNGNSEILVDHILAGATQAGASAEKVRLHDLSVRPCTACEACQVSVAEPCIIEDDMASLLDKVRQADGLVLASPIYFFTVNAQMKAFLDRCYALFGGGTFDEFRGKSLAVALTYGDPDPLMSGANHALGMFLDAARFLGMGLAGCVHASCLKAGEVQSNRKALADAEALGRKLAGP